MLRKNPTGHFPQVAASAFIDPTALICGHVIIEDNVFVGPYAVIRADEIDKDGKMAPITIKHDSNIQDGVVIHSLAGAEVTIGAQTSIAHRAIVHGPCIIEDDVFVGFNCVVFRTKIASGCVIRHSSVIDNIDLPDAVHVPPMTNLGPSSDLKTLPTLTPSLQSFSTSVVAANQYLVKGYQGLENDE